MKLIHSYSHKDKANGLRSLWRQSVLTFVNRYAESFEIIARSGNMFGGNVVPANRSLAKASRVGTTGNEIVHVQRQVNEIARTVAQLNDQVSRLAAQTPADSIPATGRSANRNSKKSTRTADIGINRFRALEGKA